MAYKNPKDPRIRAYRRQWGTENPEKCRIYKRRSYLKRQYGVSGEEYDAMLAAQGNVCAVCGTAPVTGKNLAIDHNHKSGRIRGLLCQGKGRCNWVLGILERTKLVPPEKMGVFGSYLLSEGKWPWIVPDRKKKRRKR